MLLVTRSVPHPEIVITVPAGGSNSEVEGGKLTGFAEGTLRSKGSFNCKSTYHYKFTSFIRTCLLRC